MESKITKDIPQKSISWLCQSWDQAHSIEPLLKAYQSRSLREKGILGERLCLCFFYKKTKVKLFSKNIRTPYGEIDLIFIDQYNNLFFIEVKMVLGFRESSQIWSHRQRLRFLKSIDYISKKEKRNVKDYGLFIIFKSRLSYICSTDIFF